MINILRQLTTYDDSKIIYELEVRPKLDVGEFYYDETWKKLYITTEVDDETETITGFELTTSTSKTIPYSAAFKAYFSSEIAELIPLDITIPQRFPEGWACVTDDGKIVRYKDVTFFESEIHAFSKFFIYLLRINLIEPNKLKQS